MQARVSTEINQRIAEAIDVPSASALYRDEIERKIEMLRAELHEAIKISSGKEAAARAERLEEMRRDVFFVPRHGVMPALQGPYMAYSTCSAADMKHQRYVEFCKAVGIEPVFHRKPWEWAFVAHHLLRLGAVANGKHGLVFGVGTEPLPSYFASLGTQIVATDAPPEVGELQGWRATDQFADSAERLWRGSVIDRETFLRHVSYETCDMSDISDHLTGFDFCWSSCCFEHLGSLEAGADFVVNSVERTLKPGGIAVHTTEFNLTSNDETVADGPTVIYRRRDIETLIRRLRARGHEVDDLRVAPDKDPLDFYVDTPPYKHAPHLKLRLWTYSATSVGLVIRRGSN